MLLVVALVQLEVLLAVKLALKLAVQLAVQLGGWYPPLRRSAPGQVKSVSPRGSMNAALMKGKLNCRR